MADRTCTCGRPHYARGLCKKDYHAALKHGRTSPQSHMDRFLAATDRTGECWSWMNRLTPAGYGQFAFGNRKHYAHRASWLLMVGPIPVGMEVDHVCSNRSCVRPDHLRLVTRKQNMQHVRGKSGSTSQYRGVYRNPHGWVATIGYDGKSYYLGSFATEEEAAETARLKRLEVFTHNDLDRR